MGRAQQEGRVPRGERKSGPLTVRAQTATLGRGVTGTGPELNDRSGAAVIEVELGGFPSGETKTLVRQGRLLVVISHAAAPKAPPWAQTEDITRRATERATRTLDDA
ncbi:hypothetical protein ACFZCL_00980 [Streptomyces sp. NPDC008159]|uniref:hypothetical protein n=1 Tax=Streptomyces sp. NPDC008159 TaxID=3364817 RepID=UPI0036E7DB3A